MILSRVLVVSSAVLWTSCAREGAVVDAGVAAPSPYSKLDRMDTRAPVPLLPMMANHQKQNMREHLEAVQQIIAALAADDFAAVETAAGRIGFSEQMGTMCNHMGAGAPGFTDQALGFHRQADRIGEAARSKDKARVLTELNATLLTCTACHAKWKQQLVDEGAWAKATGSAAPTMPH
jgi:cytochrome c556